MHTDINQKSWIEFLPEALRPYGYLARLDRPIGIWLLLLPGWWAIALAAGGALSMNGDDWKVAGLFAVGAVVMRAAGCVVNDLWDRDLDRRVERTALRPLAAGTVSRPQAFAFLLFLLLIGLSILLQLSLVAVLLGILVMPLIALYPLMKRITWWPQAFLGLTFNFGVLMGWAAVSYVVGLPALLLYGVAILWTLGYDTIYAHQDKEDDAKIGIKSAALKLGACSKKVIAGFYAAAFLLLLAAMVAAQAGVLSCILLLLPAAHTALCLRKWNPDNPNSSLSVFKASRDTGLLVLLAIAF
ncbi:MAG: 4-hydroxybenzoate octaprenyltransferase [Rhodospirillales bacterium]|nr:4-hydroxybenzoate octaprenyltransferase [Rhodospirillales bacterium]